MTPGPLLNVESLAALIGQGACRVFDCRFNLADPGQGRRDWLAGHIPGAAFADLDRDLAGPITDRSGRHPLPEAQDFAAFLARSGWRPGMPVVAYDAQGGAFAARLWWLLRYFGIAGGRILDGGWNAWCAAGGAVAVGEETFDHSTPVDLQADSSFVLDTAAVADALGEGDITLLDARDADRFAGDNETIDPVAGHVPGALNRPFRNNLDAQGRFLPPERLAAGFDDVLDGRSPEQVVHMCGSGVTACHNQLAMELAGLPSGRIYPGSWSEWIRDPRRPVAGRS